MRPHARFPRPVRRRKLRDFKKRHKRMQDLRGRRAHLRKAWQRMPPGHRKQFRQRMMKRHQERMKKLSTKQRKRMQQRAKRRTVRMWEPALKRWLQE